jgi:hypothetical protein
MKPKHRILPAAPGRSSEILSFQTPDASWPYSRFSASTGLSPKSSSEK